MRIQRGGGCLETCNGPEKWVAVIGGPWWRALTLQQSLARGETHAMAACRRPTRLKSEFRGLGACYPNRGRRGPADTFHPKWCQAHYQPVILSTSRCRDDGVIVPDRGTTERTMFRSCGVSLDQSGVMSAQRMCSWLDHGPSQSGSVDQTHHAAFSRVRIESSPGWQTCVMNGRTQEKMYV